LVQQRIADKCVFSGLAFVEFYYLPKSGTRANQGPTLLEYLYVSACIRVGLAALISLNEFSLFIMDSMENSADAGIAWRLTRADQMFVVNAEPIYG
jgi:hypothetical protein